MVADIAKLPEDLKQRLVVGSERQRQCGEHNNAKAHQDYPDGIKCTQSEHPMHPPIDETRARRNASSDDHAAARTLVSFEENVSENESQSLSRSPPPQISLYHAFPAAAGNP